MQWLGTASITVFMAFWGALYATWMWTLFARRYVEWTEQKAVFATVFLLICNWWPILWLLSRPFIRHH